MTYKEKLKTCPVCGKPHGLTIKEKIFSKNENFKCKNCNTVLETSYFVMPISFIISILFALFLRYIMKFKFVTDSTKYLIISIGWCVSGYLCLFFFPLKVHRDYWQEFWDKDLK